MNPIVEEILTRLDDDHREEFEERAAIMEYDGKIPRDHAECLALLDVIKNNPAVLLGNTRKEEDLI